MEIVVTRSKLTKKSSIGEAVIFTVPPKHLCYTLEPVIRPEGAPKEDGDTAIPLGRYELIINHSPSFHVDMPILLDVPGFTGVRWHWGNWPKDTRGCTLVGTRIADVPDEILESVDSYKTVLPQLLAARERGERIFVTYKLADGLAPL
jgi:hypothetical protein